MKAYRVKAYRVSKNENDSKLTAVLTAITVKNRCHWRYAANKKASLEAQGERKKTPANTASKALFFNPSEIKKRTGGSVSLL
jgi:hypothetical protein